ncbi:MAG: class I SAM-dependent methyltransferase [Leptospiraceae bacterium]
MIQFKDHFSRQSGDYAKFRPHYPVELFDQLSRMCSNQSALDIGTGNGQCAHELARFFKTVIAIDPSENQIAHARLHPSIQFRVAPAEKTGCEDESMDLITVAQALHWFDHKRFFAETFRVLRPGGLLAAWGYGHHLVEGCQDAMDHYYHNVVGPYWPPERESIEAQYQDIEVPSWLLQTDPPVVEMKAFWDRNQLLGYISTWSAVQKYMEENRKDPVPLLEEALKNCWPEARQKRTVKWPFFFIIGRKP